MLNRNAQYHEWLLPYLEGGLDEARRAQLEARLAADPALAAEAKRLARMAGGLRGAASRTAPAENAQVPADLWPHLRARLVLDPAPRPRARAWWLAGVGAPAAAALIVAAFWLPGWHLLSPPALAPKPVARPNPMARPKPAALPKSVEMPKAAPVSPAPPAAPKPAAPAPLAMGLPAPSAKPVTAAKLNAAVPNAARPAPVVTRATPFDLPVPAPPVRRAVAGSPTPSAIPAAPGALAAQVPRPMGVATKSVVTAPPAPPVTPLSALAPLKPQPPPTPTAPPVTAGAAGVVPKETQNGLVGNAARRTKTQPNAAHLASPAVPADAAPAFTPDGAVGLDSWQAALAAAVRSPLWGENEGDTQATQALMATRESGQLDDLRARLEARRTQSPRDLVAGRMLAAVYDFGFSPESALRERRRITGLEGADGEDWYALAHAEERAGNSTAARAAYRRALESPVPPSPFHAAIARGK